MKERRKEKKEEGKKRNQWKQVLYIRRNLEDYPTLPPFLATPSFFLIDKDTFLDQT